LATILNNLVRLSNLLETSVTKCVAMACLAETETRALALASISMPQPNKINQTQEEEEASEVVAAEAAVPTEGIPVEVVVDRIVVLGATVPKSGTTKIKNRTSKMKMIAAWLSAGMTKTILRITLVEVRRKIHLTLSHRSLARAVSKVVRMNSVASIWAALELIAGSCTQHLMVSLLRILNLDHHDHPLRNLNKAEPQVA